MPCNKIHKSLVVSNDRNDIQNIDFFSPKMRFLSNFNLEINRI